MQNEHIIGSPVCRAQGILDEKNISRNGKSLTSLLLPQMDHDNQRKASACYQCGNDAQHDAHDHSGEVAVIVHYCAHISHFPIHIHLQEVEQMIFTFVEYIRF